MYTSKRYFRAFIVLVCLTGLILIAQNDVLNEVEPLTVIVTEVTVVNEEDYNVLVNVNYEVHTLVNQQYLDDVKMLAQLCQAEAGNQGLTGMRYVADVVLNRVEDERFPDTIEEVIYQNNQFSVIKNGAFDKAESVISDEAYEAAEMELNSRLDEGIIYFSSTTDPANGHNAWKYQDHWFSY